MLADLRVRLRSLLRRDAVESDLDDEMRFHFEHLCAKYVAAGMTPDEAARRARLDFGGLDQIKEEHRDARGVTLVETLAQDIRYGIRMLRRTPAFSLTTIVTMGFCTAAVATVFALW